MTKDKIISGLAGLCVFLLISYLSTLTKYSITTKGIKGTEEFLGTFVINIILLGIALFIGLKVRDLVFKKLVEKK